VVRPEAYLIPLYVTIQSVFENVNGTATGNVHGQIHNSLTEKILYNVQSTEQLVMSNCCERQPQSYIPFIALDLFYYWRLSWTGFRGVVKRCNTIRDAILTCAGKPTGVSLIYRTETTTKNCKTEKLKRENRYARSNSKSLVNHVVSSDEGCGSLCATRSMSQEVCSKTLVPVVATSPCRCCWSVAAETRCLARRRYQSTRRHY